MTPSEAFQLWEERDSREWIAEDFLSSPEYFQWLREMTDEELAQHIKRIAKKENAENPYRDVEKATPDNIYTVAALAQKLWPHHTQVELAMEFEEILANGETAIFLAYEDGAAVGFAQCQLRHDYVEGTSTSPVGYLEGIFVSEPYRNQGIARKLLASCERWAKEQGCKEFASDCELINTQSLAFHLSLGFKEANRIICFTKKL